MKMPQRRRGARASRPPDQETGALANFVVVSGAAAGVSNPAMSRKSPALGHIYKMIRGFEFTNPGKGGIV